MTMQEAYQEKYKAKLKEFDAEIDKVAAKMDQAEADAKIRFKEYLEGLRRQRSDFSARFENLNKASGDALKELQTGFERAWDQLSKSFGAKRDKPH